MKGHIRQRGKESWEVTVDLPREASGKRRQQRKTVKGGKRKAQRELAKMITEIEEGTYVEPAQVTVAEYFGDWLKEHAERNCSPKTIERYKQMTADYVLPRIGAVKLTKVSTLMLERMYNDLRDRGGRFRKRAKDRTIRTRPLSIKTVRHVAGLVHTAFATAIRWKLLKFSPAEACELPKADPTEAKVVNAGQLDWMLDAAKTEVPWVHPFLEVAVATGCRRGELLALTRPDCELDAEPPCINVSKSLEQTKAGLRLKTTKNRRARRFKLPKRAVEILRMHLAKQDEHRRLFEGDYRTDLDLVFAGPDGDYLKPDSVTSKVSLLARKCGLKGISLHSLRHTHGSQLLSAGVPLPVVSKRLGHSSVKVTADVYAHALEKDELAAADAWDALMERPTSKPQTEGWQSVGKSPLPN